MVNVYSLTNSPCRCHPCYHCSNLTVYHNSLLTKMSAPSSFLRSWSSNLPHLLPAIVYTLDTHNFSPLNTSCYTSLCSSHTVYNLLLLHSSYMNILLSSALLLHAVIMFSMLTFTPLNCASITSCQVIRVRQLPRRSLPWPSSCLYDK